MSFLGICGGRIDYVRPFARRRWMSLRRCMRCNTATDDAIHFALQKKAKTIVVVPCCQAEVASVLRKNKGHSLSKNVLTEMWRHPLHTREFGSQITNVLRCMQLESHGYQVSVTELVGWEHSMKNELIIAQFKDLPRGKPAQRLSDVLETLGLEEMRERFFTPLDPGVTFHVFDPAGVAETAQRSHVALVDIGGVGERFVARSMLASRNKWKIGYGARFVKFSMSSGSASSN